MQGTEPPGSLRVALLGPVQAWQQETELNLGPRQQQLLFALLLARAGRPVQFAEIIDLVWGSAPPPTAVNMVHRYVSGLRRILEPGLKDRMPGRYILREANGYRFVPAGVQVDLLQFRENVRQARELVAAGNDDKALDLLTLALGQWRGRYAAGLGAAAEGHPDFTAIDREYAAALRESAPVARRCSRSGEILPLLREAAQRDPLDEALQAELLLALAADGKQSEAFALFAQIRRRLVEELGVDPGAELTAVYESLLGSGPAAPAAAAVAVHLPPAQLPLDFPLFTGREDLTAAATALLTAASSTVPIVAFDGMPGIGKSALAVHVAHRVTGHFPDGQLYADLHGFDALGKVADPGVVLQGFLQAMGLRPETVPPNPDARAALLRSVLAGRRVLVVLDNARDAEQLRFLLPGTAGNAVLVTSRSPLTHLATTAGAQLRTLDLPTMAEARTMMTKRIGRRASQDPAALDEIIQWCARLPLAMSIVAVQAAVHPDQPLAAITQELRQSARALDAVGDEDPDLRAVFSWSYRTLSPRAARLFRLLPLFPGPDITLEIAASLTGEAMPAVRRQMTELVRAGLIAHRRPTRYQLHDLVRSYGLELAAEIDSTQDRTAAFRGVFEHYLHSAAAAVSLLRPGYQVVPLPPRPAGIVVPHFGDEAAVMQWASQEKNGLHAVVTEAAERDHGVVVWPLALLAKDLYHRHGWWTEWAAMFATVLTAAERSADLQGLAHSHRGLAVAQHYLGDPDAADHHLKIADELFDRLGNDLGRSLVRMSVGYIAQLRGQPQTAIEHLTPALASFSRLGQRQLEAVVLATLADAHLAAGDLVRSAETATRATHLCCALQDAWNGTRAEATLALIHRLQGSFTTAIRLHHHSIDMMLARRAALDVGHHRNRLAETLFSAGKLKDARRVWEQVDEDFADNPLAPPAAEARQRLATV